MGTWQSVGNRKLALLLNGDHALKKPYEDRNTLIKHVSLIYSYRTYIASVDNTFEISRYTPSSTVTFTHALLGDKLMYM